MGERLKLNQVPDNTFVRIALDRKRTDWTPDNGWLEYPAVQVEGRVFANVSDKGGNQSAPVFVALARTSMDEHTLHRLRPNLVRDAERWCAKYNRPLMDLDGCELYRLGSGTRVAAVLDYDPVVRAREMEEEPVEDVRDDSEYEIRRRVMGR